MRPKSMAFLVSVFLCSAVVCQKAVFADEAKVKDAMAVLKEKTQKLGAAQAMGNQLFFGSSKMNGVYTIVDEVKTEKNCTATLFVKVGTEFIRISTNVVVDGSRAVGTPLNNKNKAYESLIKGEPFYGTIDVLGKQYDAGYEPIKDAAGNVVGAYYIGFAIQ